MMETYCIPCVYGQHDEHIEMIEVPMPGVMGGARCPCKGECGSRKGEAMSAGEVDPAEHAKVVDELHHREREFAEVCANEDCLEAKLDRARARIEELEAGRAYRLMERQRDQARAEVRELRRRNPDAVRRAGARFAQQASEATARAEAAEARCVSIRAETVAEIMAAVRESPRLPMVVAEYAPAVADFIEREFPAPVQADTEETP